MRNTALEQRLSITKCASLHWNLTTLLSPFIAPWKRYLLQLPCRRDLLLSCSFSRCLQVSGGGRLLHCLVLVTLEWLHQDNYFTFFSYSLFDNLWDLVSLSKLNTKLLKLYGLSWKSSTLLVNKLSFVSKKKPKWLRFPKSYTLMNKLCFTLTTIPPLSFLLSILFIKSF